MKKIFNIILLIPMVIIGLQYACSSDVLDSFGNNIELDANDPRISMVMLMDSIKANGSSVETLAIGESTEHYQQYARVEVGKFYKHDRTNHITISALVLVTVDSVGNLIYPTTYQEMTGYPISLSVAFPSNEASLVRWSQNAAYARKAGRKEITIEVRGVFNDFDGYFTKDKPEVVNVDVSKTVGVLPM
ncbi:MAG: hypothetical protein E7071_09300 [Bacteroidales bacterium]|nr:hypothetical protein [Bacteroidales bacterium]